MAAHRAHLHTLLMSYGPNQELDDLFARPLVSALFNGQTHILVDGFTIEDVFLELYQFGDVTLRTVETSRTLAGKPWPWMLCTVTPHNGDKEVAATGQTATAAALRCLIGLLKRFDQLANLTTSRIEAFMEGTGDLTEEAQAGIDALIEFLANEHPPQ
jgi:hypothetical protein